jgi:hypothetical protein
MAKTKQGKRDRVGMPSRSGTPPPTPSEGDGTSPTKPPDPKRLNYGDADLMNVEDAAGTAVAAATGFKNIATAAAEEAAAIAAAAAAKASADAAAAKAASKKAKEEAEARKKAARKETPQERKQRLALQKELGQKIPVGGLKDYLASQEDNDEEMEETPPAVPKSRGSRGRSLDSQCDRRSTKAKQAEQSRSRGSSVDSSFNTKSGKREDPDDSDDDESTKGRRKSASFKEGTLNNEGKTASTEKAVREKKKESYANKAKLSRQRSLGFIRGWSHMSSM